MKTMKSQTTIIRTYTDLVLLPDFFSRYEYLRLNGKVGEELFGYSRYLNQVFYQSDRWKRARRRAILRDNGCDLGVDGRDIYGTIYVHHMNPITLEQLKNDDPCLTDLNFLICTSRKTHEAITLGDASLLPYEPVIRRPNDTCPWKQ